MTCRDISLRVHIVHLNGLLLIEACVDVCRLRHSVCVDRVAERASTATHGGARLSKLVERIDPVEALRRLVLSHTWMVILNGAILARAQDDLVRALTLLRWATRGKIERPVLR